ncbi:MAG: type I CRISPR-associated protein Cas7 [Planctomycetota bacterium]|nr:type I CRISPR-associated protein Cas7 [Planctomycetota bacterium]
MSNNGVHTSEILFVKCVKDGIPNRDPLRDSDARRIFGEDDGRISLSDVSIKRDVRDYVLARYPDGGPHKDRFVFVRKEFTGDGSTLLGRDGLANAILEHVRAAKEPGTEPLPSAPVISEPARQASLWAGPGTEPLPSAAAKAGKRGGKATKGEGGEDVERTLLAAAFDMRVFGAVFSVKGKSFNRVGPVQFGWAHSLHPVETKYTQGTVCMPSQETKAATADEEATGKTQGTIWTQYHLPFAVFAMPGVVSASIARDAVMSGGDVDTLLEGLWKGTLARQARGRGLQQPLLLLHVEYTDPFFRIGFLEEGLRLEPGREKWLGSQPPTSLAEITLNVEGLARTLEQHANQIARARVWLDPQLKLVGKLPTQPGEWPKEG